MLAVIALVVAALGAALSLHDREPPARPALWHITGYGKQAWLFGTIHAVPRDARWISPVLEAAIAQSDRLVLEANGLDDERRDRAIFERLGRNAALPPISQRLDPVASGIYQAFARTHSDVVDELDRHEDWAAALLVGSYANGDLGLSAQAAPDARLEAMFTENGKAVTGLETIEEQLGQFDNLSAAAQRKLLVQALKDAPHAHTTFEALYRAWSRGDVDSLQRQFLDPLAEMPDVRESLIDHRNSLWAGGIDALIRERDGISFIAVGAGHLLGNASLQSRLSALGWTARRVQ